ncbi:conjugative transfer relaxase/helicase TraI [Vibrio jasicida]|uniref:conjugative transfer relaxase/helicase TraI n=1 Tax=Vibrio jasicida TaxID=766224 RepID=UPI000CE4F2EA|nr:conjugative transfer relaxase/helicase TraI [Vibrio jasicida]
MMSISPLKSASNAAKYYLGEENPKHLPDVSLEQSGDNYYLKEQDQTENTFWHGKLAEEAGLLGKPVEQETLTSVLSGQLGKETIKGKRDDHKSGFDLTFSAPKCASVLALVGGDSRLIDAHNKAVKFTLSELEKDVAQVTKTNEKGEREFVNSESMIFAVVRHKTSRENEPQMHSHSLAANITRDDEGSLRTLASTIKQKGGVINGSGERIYNFQKYYTALYQSELAKGAEELGYVTRGVGKGQFEIEGVPEKLLDAFSTRKKQIDQQALEFGDSQQSRDVAALDTRKSKTYESDASLNTKWQSDTVALGFEPSELVSNAKQVIKRERDPESVAKEAFGRAVEHLGQTSTSLKLEKVVELAAGFGQNDKQASALDLKVVADQWIKNGSLIPLTEKGSYTTKQMVENEKALFNITQGRTHHLRTPVNESTLEKLNLPQSHRKKVSDIYESTKQFHVVNVYGDSKLIAQNLLNVGNHVGKRVHLVSQTAKEQRQGSETIQRESHTVSAWVKELFEKDNRHSLRGFLNTGASMTNKDVILVDNANKMSANELIAMTSKANESGSKLVLLNRTTSRQGFKANNSIDLYSKGNVVEHSWVNNKQIDSKVVLHDSDTKQIAQTYARLPDKDRVQVLATSSVEQRRLTNEIRNSLQNDGQLSRLGITLFTQQPHYLSKQQKDLAQHYKSGMTLRHWEEGKPKEYVVTTSDKQLNEVHVLDKKDGQEKIFKPSSSEFKSLNMQLFKPEAIQINQGERITATSKHFSSGFEANERYTVLKTSEDALTLRDSEGNTKTVSLTELKDAPIKYDYAHSANQVEQRAHTLILGKAFTLSKELLNDLTEKSERIDLFTNNVEKAHKALEKSEVNPSAIERVMHSSNVNDRYLSSATEASLKGDVQAALKVLGQGQAMSAQEKAVSFALNHLAEKEAAFTQKELVVEAVRYAFEESQSPISKEQIESELSKRNDLLSAEYSDGTRWTTQKAIDTEKHILGNIKEGRGQHQPYATHDQVEDYLNSQPRLTGGQKDSVTLVTTTEDSFVLVQGLAGTGKSTMLESNIELIQHATNVGENKLREVIGLAPTHAAVSELESKGVKAQTLESLLAHIRNGERTPTDYENTLFFLDESSMVSNGQAREFTDLVLQSNSKATLLGDKEQLLSLSAGKPFGLALSQGDIDVAYMTDIVRQRSESNLGAVKNILDKQPLSALDKLSKQAPDHSGSTQHIVSTLDKNAKDSPKAQREATEKLPFVVAQDYLSRTPETRENTLIIAYTNVERDKITDYIRSGLAKNKEIGQENVIATRLRSTGDSKEELSTMMPYQKGLVISTKAGEYGTIKEVSTEHGVVIITDSETGKDRSFYPRNRDHKFTTLFSKSERSLSTGDKIVTRFTDKSRDIKANVEYRVHAATKEQITAKSMDGKTLTIDPNEMKDGHWDYAYTRTADMAQGSTYKNVITAIQGKGSLTNLRRAYIDLSRASEHVKLYTDNSTQMMRSWLANESDKRSALETIEKPPTKDNIYFNENPVPQEDVRFQDKDGSFDYSKFKEHINVELPRYTESLATHILGKPNQSKSDRDYLTFGVGQSAIKVSLTGDYRGYFKDYTTGKKGSLINLLMSHKELSYKEAMNLANNMISEPDKYEIAANEKHDALVKTTPRHIAQFEERAKQYIRESVDIKGTLVETYLNKLGINEPQSDHVRFHPTVYSSEDKLFHPAMLTNIHNKEGETKAIEVTYLNDKGNINRNLDINPRTLGTKSKQITRFHDGTDLNTTIISTSIENSFLINQEQRGQYDIINVNHKNDIQNISNDELRRNIIVVLSKGNTDLNPNNIDKIVENFSGRNINFVSHDNIHSEIQACIDKFNVKGEVTRDDIERLDELVNPRDDENTRIISQHNKEEDSKNLERFEQKDIPKQKEFDFDEIEIERELER